MYLPPCKTYEVLGAIARPCGLEALPYGLSRLKFVADNPIPHASNLYSADAAGPDRSHLVR